VWHVEELHSVHVVQKAFETLAKRRKGKMVQHQRGTDLLEKHKQKEHHLVELKMRKDWPVKGTQEQVSSMASHLKP
jgi:hypothetical protein